MDLEKQMIFLRSILSVSSALALVGAAEAAAEESDWASRRGGVESSSGFIGQIALTATKREEDVQGVPNSISVYLGDQLNALGVTNISIKHTHDNSGISVQSWVRNLFDEEYRAYTLNLGILGTTSFFAQQRTFGGTQRAPFEG